ncbi:hypothetical protein ISF_07195 [Cordyceps fumosorosea ARSEF 2679]|uniref:Uncharacterized protein n=1 Tax=Cordyceps fumosorosea (strain ARSEF 2679) TaxID=1081104 RepID=A0A167Q4C9_CORFA|nr:hypothetical protein ISF_07195 [Cordyceps fumosorosea ARSEF 2679]OAA57274.1 hypothetical protein ISF_07195 [Cordyceps fumosorosea ARSEF 2679]
MQAEARSPPPPSSWRGWSASGQRNGGRISTCCASCCASRSTNTTTSVRLARAPTEYAFLQLRALAPTPFPPLSRTSCHHTKACLVVVTSSTHRQDVYLFEATISTALLDQLDDPRICPKRPTPPIVINRSVINVDPAKSFGTRVVAALAGYGRLRDEDGGSQGDSRGLGDSSSSDA